jgi:hypothetical protein
VIVAAGFLLFTVPSAGVDYWKTFFPAFTVLGLGMAVSVAPLTTVVMGSVQQDRAGTASGINNAVARVAGVLAVAVLGVVMVEAFGHALYQRLVSLGLESGLVRDLQSKAIQLGATSVPAGLDKETAGAVRFALNHAFVFGFRVVMLICMGLALASSGVAAWTISSRTSEAARKSKALPRFSI